MFDVFIYFSLGRIVMYNIFMVVSRPKTLAKNLFKSLVKNLTRNPDKSSDKLIENCQTNMLSTSKQLPEAPPAKPEVANKPVRNLQLSHAPSNRPHVANLLLPWGVASSCSSRCSWSLLCLCTTATSCTGGMTI